MSKKAIETINRVEAKADRIRADAVARAKADTEKATEESRRLCEETEARMRQTYREETEKLRQKTAAILEDKKQAAQDEADALEKAAGLHMAEAKKLIVRRMEEQCQ